MNEPFAFDGRGNRLLAWELVEDPHRVLICAQTAVFRQVYLGLLNERVQPRTAAFDDVADPARWTHCLAIDRVPDGLRALLDLLARTVVLCNLPASIDKGAALDFYTIPDDASPPMSWLRTEIGELVHTMKYAVIDQISKEQALGTIADRMAQVIERLPSFDRAVIASVPGHDSRIVSWSERLADQVGRRAERRVIRTRARSLVRAPAKAGSVDLTGEFAIDASDVANAIVVVVDDVMMSGSTMKAIGSEARRAGAPEVHILVAARTIR